ncbi:MAG: fibronectin type III domain-containing protein [Flavobacteriales bacterium]|nr:fibronectin type III domain-containing protein [Flavobacteriales bacterium]
MKKPLFLFSFLLIINFSFSQCPVPTGLFVTNITHNSVIANWTAVQGAHHYRIRIRELGAANWGNLLNIDSSMTSRLLPLLQPLTTYEWKIEAYCDSTNQQNSAWSVIDTFTTIAFVPAPFNPLLFYGMSSTLCNMHVSFSLRVMQSQNEPDIGTSEITSDGGSFDISSVSTGDTVGTAEIATSTDTIMTILTVGIITSSNNAIIYSIDTSGIVGFFTIENISGGGVKIISSSPPDNNNYTSGYNSLLIFNNLFVTPTSPGILRFTADIESELNDQFNMIDSSTVIFCNTGLNENTTEEKKLIKVVNILGKNSSKKKNTLLFYIYDDGKVEKQIIID